MFQKILDRIYKYCGVFSALWFVFIFILCATPGQYIPSASWMQLLSLDKLIHAGVFFILSGLMLAVAVKFYDGRPVINMLLVSGCVLYGALLEVMQAKFFSNRSADWYDVVTNTFGCLMALLLLKKLRLFKSRKILTSV